MYDKISLVRSHRSNGCFAHFSKKGCAWWCTRKFTHVFVRMMPGNQYGILFGETSLQRRFINSVRHREQWLSSSRRTYLLNIFNVVKLWAFNWRVFRFVLSLVKSVKLTRCTSYWNTCRNTLRNIMRVVYNTRYCRHAPETFRGFRKIAENNNLLCYVRVSVHPSVHMEQLGSHRKNFIKFCRYFFFFYKICRETSRFIKKWET